MLKILQARLQQYVNGEFLDVQVGFRKGRNQRSNCQHPLKHRKSNGLQKNIYFCFIDNAKAFNCVDHNKLWKILKEVGIPDHLTCLLRNLDEGQEATKPDMEQQTGSKLGKEYVKAVYCHPAYLTYMRSTWCKVRTGWSSRWNQDCQEKYQQPQICRWHHPYGRKWRTKEPLMKVKEKSEKGGLKLNIKKMKTMAWTRHFMANRWGSDGK